MQDLSRFTNLETLALLKFSIGPGELQGIESLENVKVLRLENASQGAIVKMMQFTKLEHLELPGSSISEANLSRILRNNIGIKQLDISGECYSVNVSIILWLFITFTLLQCFKISTK